MKKILKEQLLIPVYLNEKTVLDMLAIIEDGFSMVSEISASNQVNERMEIGAKGGFSASVLLDKLLKIQLEGAVEEQKAANDSSETKMEKVHTNVSLLSKFRMQLINNSLLSCKAGDKLDINKIETGDFIEFEGELQKNPLIDIFEQLIDIYHMSNIFEEKPALGNRKVVSEKRAEDDLTLKQVKLFLEELKHTGTIDFILKSEKGTIVLSAQEQYLQNDNISEIIGGKFKILGKVIKICADESDSINLLRKTSLNILDQDSMSEILSVFKSDDMKIYNLPELRTEIKGPSAIIIPVAIYV